MLNLYEKRRIESRVLTKTYKNMTDSHPPNSSEELRQQLQTLMSAAFKDGQLDVETFKKITGGLEKSESFFILWL